MSAQSNDQPMMNKFKSWLAQSVWQGHGGRHHGRQRASASASDDTCELSLSVLDSDTDFNRLPGVIEQGSTVALENGAMQLNEEKGVVQLRESMAMATASPQFQDTVYKAQTPRLITSQITSHLKFRANSSSGLRKRLMAIADKKEADVKQIKRFIADLNQWCVNPIFQNDSNDTQMVIEQISILFSQDIIHQTCIAKQVRDIAKNLEYVTLKESELVSDHKRLMQIHKQYSSVKTRRGEDHPETNFSLERLLAAEHAYTILKNSFQRTISITMREMFQNLSYEYYTNSEDMKTVSSDLIRDFMMSLGVNNFHKFNSQLDNIRKKRTEKRWSQFSPEDRKNPVKWDNLKSGFYERDDTLLQNIYQNVPNICSTNGLFNRGIDDHDVVSFGNEPDDFTTITTAEDKEGVVPDLNAVRRDNSEERDKYDPISTNTFLVRGHKEDIDNEAPILQPKNIYNEDNKKVEPVHIESTEKIYSTLKPVTPEKKIDYILGSSNEISGAVQTSFVNSARTENLELNNWETSVL